MAVQSFFEWFRARVEPSDPWLMLGKGPSFALRGGYDLRPYRLLGLNHVVREQPVSVAHMIDAEVIDACGELLLQNAGVVVMPWYPHQQNRPGVRTLEELAAEHPILARLAAEGRLLWYDLSTVPTRHGDGPVVEATYFSAEAGLNLLVLAGTRMVRTLGVDGGSAYSADFDDLRNQTLLANGRPSFDAQFEGFARTLLRTGVDFAPLNLPSPARVYVPHQPSDALPFAVLRYSIRRRASLTVEVLPLPAGARPPIVAVEQALVLAPATQCLTDLRPLWGGPAVRSGLPPGWAPSSRYQRGRTRFLWYGDDGRQPWLSRRHPFGYVWIEELLVGITQGLIPVELVLDEICRGHVRPSLAYQLEHRILEPLLLPRRARLLDREFRPASGRATPFAAASALGRELERRVREYRYRRRLRELEAESRVEAARRSRPVLGPADPVSPR